MVVAEVLSQNNKLNDSFYIKTIYTFYHGVFFVYFVFDYFYGEKI